MSSLLVILIGAVLVNTFLLMQNDEALSGTRESGSIASAIRIAGVTALVLVLAAVISGALWQLNSTLPKDALLFFFALTVVAVAVFLDRWSQRRYARLERAIATSPLLIVSNALALGSGLIGASNGLTVIALAISFVIAMPLFVALVSRISLRDVPVNFRVAPITLVSAGLVSLALMGFTGLLRG